MTPNETNKDTPLTDAAKEKRLQYTCQWSSEDMEKMFKATPQEQEAWLKNCPPDGWHVARQLERELNKAKRVLTIEQEQHNHITNLAINLAERIVELEKDKARLTKAAWILLGQEFCDETEPDCLGCRATKLMKESGVDRQTIDAAMKD